MKKSKLIFVIYMKLRKYAIKYRVYRSSQSKMTKVPCQQTQIVTRGCDGSKEAKEEARGSYIGQRRHQHLRSADALLPNQFHVLAIQLFIFECKM